ncbi:hypothetical protein ACFL04_00065 [Patescibacteria group bacterium]
MMLYLNQLKREGINSLKYVGKRFPVEAFIYLALFVNYLSLIYEMMKPSTWLIIIEALIGVMLISIFRYGRKVFPGVKNWKFVKILILSVLIGVVLVNYGYVIIAKDKTTSKYISDVALVSEDAVMALADRQNPYQVSYGNASTGKWDDGYVYLPIKNDKMLVIKNPTIEHLPYLPGIFIPTYPAYFLSHNIFKYFDIRWVFVMAFIIMAFFIYRLPEAINRKRWLLMLFIFNPLFIPMFGVGHNEVLVYLWLILFLFKLKNNNFTWATFWLSLAVITKQSVWPLLPFYLIYLIIELREKNKKNIVIFRRLMKIVWLPLLISLIMLAPFIVDDFSAFKDDVFDYLAGTSNVNYPVAGIGLGRLLLDNGFIGSYFDYYPFWIWQLIFSLPALLVLAFWQIRNNTIGQMMLNYALLLSVFWFMSRYFHTSHVGFIVGLIFLSYFTVKKTSPQN